MRDGCAGSVKVQAAFYSVQAVGPRGSSSAGQSRAWHLRQQGRERASQAIRQPCWVQRGRALAPPAGHACGMLRDTLGAAPSGQNAHWAPYEDMPNAPYLDLRCAHGSIAAAACLPASGPCLLNRALLHDVGASGHAVHGLCGRAAFGLGNAKAAPSRLRGMRARQLGADSRRAGRLQLQLG